MQAFRNKIIFCESQIKILDEMARLKKHDNDELIKHLLKILDLLKKPIIDEKELKKLIDLLTIAKMPEEEKVISSPLKIQLPPA